MTRLQELHSESRSEPVARQPQAGLASPAASSQRWVERGVRGITSNPSIFQKAIAGEPAYDEQFSDLIERGTSIEDTLLGSRHHRHRATRWPSSARCTTRATARTATCRSRWHPAWPGTPRAPPPPPASCTTLIDQPNLYVKIPGTAEGLPAIQQMITEGRSINVTLLFSLERYGEVIEAYLAGLEGLPTATCSTSSSVASFFVEPGRHRGRQAAGADRHGRGARAAGQGGGGERPARLRAVPRAVLGPRWEALAARGARVQRPLWASTSAKNPAYPDTLYVDDLDRAATR